MEHRKIESRSLDIVVIVEISTERTEIGCAVLFFARRRYRDASQHRLNGNCTMRQPLGRIECGDPFVGIQHPLTTKGGVVLRGNRISCCDRVLIKSAALTCRRLVGPKFENLYDQCVSGQSTFDKEGTS